MSKKELSLSVVMPAYNVEEYVVEALRSLSDSELSVKEVLVVDDGSTDDTRARVLSFAQALPIQILSQPNKGAGPARNLGASESVGEYIYFFDSDDRLAGNFLSELHRLIEDNSQPDIIAFSGRAFTQKDFKTNLKFDYHRHVSFSGLTGFEAVKKLIENKSFYAQPSLYVVKRSHWMKVGQRFPPGLHQDEDVIVPLFLEASSVVVTTACYFERRVRPFSTMTKEKSIEHLLGREKNVRKCLEQLSRIPSKERDLRKMLRKRCEMFADAYMSLARELEVRTNPVLLMRVVFRRKNKLLTRRFFRETLRSARLLFV